MTTPKVTNLSKLLSPEWRARKFSIANKRMRSVYRPSCASRPAFVVGRQRSGTGMLMRAFHWHPDVEVFDEHLNRDLLFAASQLESFPVVRDLVERSKYPVVCFKPLDQSHRLPDLRGNFPDAHFIWVFRDYCDVANSALRKFEEPTRALRLVGEGKTGGGWFQEGISDRTESLLRQAYREELSDFECMCLVWWARNQIVIESGMLGGTNLTPLKYEAVVRDPGHVLKWMFGRIGLKHAPRAARNISDRSIGRYAAPAIDPLIREMCEETLKVLDAAFQRAWLEQASSDSPIH